MDDFLGMALIIKEQREKIKQLELENRLLFEHLSGDESDLARYNAALAKALEESVVMPSLDETWKADTKKAKVAARREGWSYSCGYYVHPIRPRYRAKDMDGWIDLCGNEAIEWD